MPRQSISLTRPNAAWLKDKMDSEEFSSKSEVVNDLIRRARETEHIRAKLIKAEQSGFTEATKEQTLSKAKAKAKARKNGLI